MSTETIEEAVQWDRDKEAALRSGLCHVCASQFAWGLQNGFATVRQPCEACLPKAKGRKFKPWLNVHVEKARPLLKHMAAFYTDRHIEKDLAAVLDACESQAERDIVLRYAALRKKAAGYRPGSHERKRAHSTHEDHMITEALRA